ncbi:hypothetical protein [Lichenicoccus roseus]|uniref:Uncharacterized protein n=1 Tax=Lichenicoccus roseus TaxID=2683649 RepID=A0A5R9JFU7_9PROT|nr:hypothetical protein [Lichenicoccus roseus]TLU74541.1 hypothetical protein FE263_05060 [Lichenicoccus roseus]
MVNAIRDGTSDWRISFHWTATGAEEEQAESLIVFGIAEEAVALEEANLSLGLAERRFSITSIAKTGLPFLLPLWMTSSDH